MSSIIDVKPLSGLHWETADPFLFCAYHLDSYPAGNESMGPQASLAGRKIGMDFEGKDGWRMYHGSVVPGFPQHPHRGFETVTLVRRGLCDHSDSLGAAARFGEGDVQWITAGKGIVHSEMFPLLKRDEPNPFELFQIWLNLPARNKLADPHFAVFWNGHIPRLVSPGVEVTVIAGELAGAPKPLAPPPNSWASQPGSEVAIWTLKLAPGAEWTLPPASPGLNRMLFFFRGTNVTVDSRPIEGAARIPLRSDAEAKLVNGTQEGEFLLLQGRPINEPIAQYGPFVMNREAELHQAFADYRRTQFGGWPWPVDDPAHPRDAGRFAKYPDSRTERP